MKTLIKSALTAAIVMGTTLSASGFDFTPYIVKKVNIEKKEIKVIDITDFDINNFVDFTVQPGAWTTEAQPAGQLISNFSFRVIRTQAAPARQILGALKLYRTGEAQSLVTLHSTLIDFENSEEVIYSPTNVQLPVDLQAGRYALGFEIDPNNSYAEINEQNNKVLVEFFVGHTQGELGVSDSVVSFTDPIYNKDRACQESYGQYARYATWNDVERYDIDHSMKDWIEDHSMQRDDQFYVRFGDLTKAVIRGTKMTSLSALDNVEKHRLELQEVSYTRGYNNQTLCWIPEVQEPVDYYDLLPQAK